MPKLLRVDLLFHWGFWIRAPLFSARQPTYSFPLPTTLVGALARGYLNLEKARGRLRGEFDPAERASPFVAELGTRIKAVYFRITEGVAKVNIDKTRHFQAPYIRKEDVKDFAKWFGVRDVGKVYAPGVKAEAAFLIDWDSDDIKAAALSITRVGPVEGLVTPLSAELIDVGECREAADLRYPCPYFPTEAASLPIPWTIAEFLDWRERGVWTRERYFEPPKVRYAVPKSEWAITQPEFPSCSTLRDVVKIVECGGRPYPWPQ